MALSHSQKLRLQTNDGIVLCRGRNGNGEIFWLYIKAEKKAIERMYRDYEKKSQVNFLEYGEVIKKGISEQVPEDVCRFMEEKYGFKHTN